MKTLDNFMGTDFTADRVPPVKIVVIGVGGGGCNAVNRMIERGIKNVDLIAINTDKQALQASSNAPIRLLIGEKTTGGWGAGADPAVGQKAAEDSKLGIKDKIKDAHMVFITAGMGGGTGTGAAPVIAQIAREMDKLVVAVVTKPFRMENEVRANNAELGIAKLRKFVDTLIVIPNDNLKNVAGKTCIDSAFKYADDVLVQCVKGICDVIMVPSMLNLDFADVTRVMKGKGTAHIGTGRGVGANMAVEAVRDAINCPLIETTIEGARSVLIQFFVGKDTVSLAEVEAAADLVGKVAADGAEIIFGLGYIDTRDEAFVTIIATGLDSPYDNRDGAKDNARGGAGKKLGHFGESGGGYGGPQGQYRGTDNSGASNQGRQFGQPNSSWGNNGDAWGNNSFGGDASKRPATSIVDVDELEDLPPFIKAAKDKWNS